MIERAAGNEYLIGIRLLQEIGKDRYHSLGVPLVVFAAIVARRSRWPSS